MGESHTVSVRVSRRLADALARGGKRHAAAAKFLALLAAANGRLASGRVADPNDTSDHLHIAVADRATARALAQSLAGVPGVEAAYAKPLVEPPGPPV